MEATTYTIGSCCSGYAGLEAGVQLALGPAQVLWHSEFDKHPSAILEYRFPGVPNYGDLTKLDWAQVPRVDVLTAGFPCQDVSHAGLRRGLREGTRTGIWSHIATGISVLRPPLVVLENVKGLLSAAADSNVEPCPWCLGDTDGQPPLRALGAVLADLAELGYDARWGVVRASDAGAPHGRARVFVVATDARSAGTGWDAGAVPRTVQGRSLLDVRAVGDGGAAAAPDASDDGRERGGAARGGRPRPQDSGHRAPDTAGAGLEGAEPASEPGVPRRRGEPAADAAGDGRGEGRAEPAGLLGGPDAAERGDAPDAHTDGVGPQGQHHDPSAGGDASGAAGRAVRGGDAAPDPDDADGRSGHTEWRSLGRDAAAGRGEGGVEWGAYGPAIRRWERILGRPAPRPTEPARNGQRLSPRFVEFMMGLPDGWVTDVPGLPRNAQLKALGNGVVPQQCALALRVLLAAHLEQEGAA